MRLITHTSLSALLPGNQTAVCVIYYQLSILKRKF